MAINYPAPVFSGGSFSVSLMDDTSSYEKNVLCKTTLRFLPGKRWAGVAEWGDTDVFVKLFLDPAHAARHWRREESGARALLERDILTPPLLYSGLVAQSSFVDELQESSLNTSSAYSQRLTRSLYILIFQLITPAQTLLSAWQKSGEEEQQALLHNMMGVLAAHHRACLTHNDMHFANFLIQGTRIFTLDGDQIKLSGQSLSRHASLMNLALLFAQLPPHCDNIVEAVFPAYITARRWEPALDDMQMLTAGIRCARQRRTDKYMRKIFRTSSVIACRQSVRHFVAYTRRYDSPELQQLLADPDYFLQDNHCHIIKRGHTATVGLIVVDGRELVIKRYNIKNLRHAFSRAIRATRAAASWRNAHLLRFYDIATPEPVALIEKRLGFLRYTSYFISSYVQGQNSLEYFSTALQQTRRDMADKIIVLLHKLAADRITHGDMKATNVLISFGEPLLVDLDALRQHHSTFLFKRSWYKDQRRWLRNWENQPDIKNLFATALNF